MAGKKTKLKDGEHANAVTYYDSDSHTEAVDETAKSMGMNRSEFIRWAVAPHIEKYKNGEVTKPVFNVKTKTDQQLLLRKKEQEIEKSLQIKHLSGDETDYAIMRKYVANGAIGAGRNLEGDLVKALAKLRLVEINPSVPFDDSAKIAFCKFLEIIIERRAIEKEINDYWKSQSA